MENNSIEEEKEKKITHIAGTFIIDANGSHLNGGGLGGIEWDNYTIVKMYKDGPRDKGGYYWVPYVSAPSWRRWLRDTIVEETGLPASQIRALHKNPKGNTDKIGTERDPISYIEDDIFGYMFPISKEDQALSRKAKAAAAVVEVEEDEDEELEVEGNGKQQEESLTVRGLFRTSTFTTSILRGLRKDGWEGKDQNYVSLIEGSSQPYKTQFMNTPLQAVFTLDYSRLGVFQNIGDRSELDQAVIDKYLANNMIIERTDLRPEFYGLEKESVGPELTEEQLKKLKKKPKQYYTQKKKLGTTYELVNAAEIRKQRATALLTSLAVLRGGAKQAAFGTDVAPKAIIMAGLTCGNPVFNNIFEDDSLKPTSIGKSVVLKIDTLKEVITDYADRITTPVIIGIRTGFLKNEEDVRRELTEEKGFIITTPIDAARQMASML
jgi:CRISPR-associated protein Cst2